MMSVHETPMNTCEPCQYEYTRGHPNPPVGETKNENLKKKSKKKAVEDEEEKPKKSKNKAVELMSDEDEKEKQIAHKQQSMSEFALLTRAPDLQPAAPPTTAALLLTAPDIPPEPGQRRGILSATTPYTQGRGAGRLAAHDEANKPAANANKSAADDESKDEATEHDSAYESDGTDELGEANDDKFNDDDAATQRVEPEAAPKSQTESKPKNKQIPESEPQPEAREIENSPASFGSYTCPTCDNEFQNKNPLNSHRLNMHANFPCEKCNHQVRCKNSFDEHIFGHQKPRKYDCTNCQLLVTMKRPRQDRIDLKAGSNRSVGRIDSRHRKNERGIQGSWDEDIKDIHAQDEYGMDTNHLNDDQHENLQGASQPHVPEEDDEQDVRRRPQGVQTPPLPIPPSRRLPLGQGQNQEEAQEEDGDKEKQETQDDILTVEEGPQPQPPQDSALPQGILPNEGNQDRPKRSRRPLNKFQ